MKLFPGRAVWLAFSLVAVASLHADENHIPTVTLTGPAATVYTAPATITFTATASDPDGQIAKVEFYAGNRWLGQATNAPYSLTVSNTLYGKVAVHALATDNQGATGFSAEIALTIQRATSPPLTLQILHASDFQASVSEIDQIPRFASVIGALKAQYPTNTLIVSSGNNYIPGPFFTASVDPAAGFNGAKGRADIAILNRLGVQASCLGNDEFDDDTPTLRSLMLADPAVNYPGAEFPYLSANLDFSADSSLADLVTADGQDSLLMKNKLARSTVVTVAGQRIGIVGSTTPALRYVSSPGEVGVSSNLVEVIQAAVDALLAQGINKIVLLSQLQELDPQLRMAGKFRDVDVIVAGGSQAIFAKPEDHLWPGDSPVYNYPSGIGTTGGEVVEVVNTDGYYRYVGRLLVQFNEQGVLTKIDPSSGAYAADDAGVAALGNFPADPQVLNIVSNMAAIINGKDSRRFGRTEVYLNAQRNSVRTEETNLGDLTADANLARAKLTDPSTAISIKNGGGIRDSIGAFATINGQTVHVPPPANPHVGKLAGEISQLDIENSLRFNNPLTLLTITAQQLRDTMEWGVAGEDTPGQYPQVAGLAFSYQAGNAPMTYERDANGVPVKIVDAGTRLRSLVVTNADNSLDLVVENGLLVGNPNRTFRVVTIAFMAGGGDSYFALSQGTNRAELVAPGTTTMLFDTDGGEQKALADYLAQIHLYTQDDTDASQDKRIQKLTDRTDTVTAPEITGITQPNPGVAVTFRTLPGKDYTIQKRDGLNAPWEPVASSTVTGDGYPKTLTDGSTTSVPQRVFRIIRTN